MRQALLILSLGMALVDYKHIHKCHVHQAQKQSFVVLLHGRRELQRVSLHAKLAVQVDTRHMLVVVRNKLWTRHCHSVTRLELPQTRRLGCRHTHGQEVDKFIVCPSRRVKLRDLNKSNRTHVQKL